MSCAQKNLPSGGQQAVTLAETALAGYPGASPRSISHPRAARRAAEAHAVAGSATECRRMIDRAFDRLDDAHPDSAPEPAWTYWMGHARPTARPGTASSGCTTGPAPGTRTSEGFRAGARRLLLTRVYLHQPSVSSRSPPAEVCAACRSTALSMM